MHIWWYYYEARSSERWSNVKNGFDWKEVIMRHVV